MEKPTTNAEREKEDEEDGDLSLPWGAGGVAEEEEDGNYGGDVPVDRGRELLTIFEKVRERLHKEGGITSLALTFPIRELNDDHYMGMTYTQHGGWKEVSPGRRIANENVVHSIGIRLRYQNSSKCYDLQTLLSTLLHEFAHAITRGEMQYGHTEEGRRCRGWHDVAHTDEFYSNFALILEQAEALDIFTLPGDARSKWTKKNLIKYDYIDSQKNDLRGEIEGEPEDRSLPAFMTADCNNKKEARDEEPLRLTLSRKGQRKLVLLQPRTIAQLNAQVQQKFRAKGHTVKDAKGKAIALDHDLQALGQDAVLYIS